MEKKWEYRSFVCAGEEIEHILNPLGDEGWELIGMAIIFDISDIEHRAYKNVDNYRMVLKRQKEQNK